MWQRLWLLPAACIAAAVFALLVVFAIGVLGLGVYLRPWL